MRSCPPPPYRVRFTKFYVYSGITDLRTALVERAQTTLRHVVGARAVQSVVTEREAIAFEIAEIVGDVADVSQYLSHTPFHIYPIPSV